MKSISTKKLACHELVAPSGSYPSVLVVSDKALSSAVLDVQILFSLGTDVQVIDLIVAGEQKRDKLTGSEEISQTEFERQWNAIFSNYDVSAIKLGFFASQAKIDFVVSELNRRNVPVILDLMLPAYLKVFCFTEVFDYYFQSLASLSRIVISDFVNATFLCRSEITAKKDVVAVGKTLLSQGAPSVLMIISESEQESDVFNQVYFCSETDSFWLSSPRSNTSDNEHVINFMAATVTSALSQGYSLKDAVVIGKMTVNQGCYFSECIEKCSKQSKAPDVHFSQKDLPFLHKNQCESYSPKFAPVSMPDGKELPLGLYPIVDSSVWVKRLVMLGVTTLQLRNKTLTSVALENEIVRSIAIAKQHNCRLFINDYWQLAIKHQAYGVHLGQEDLDGADIAAIHSAGLRLGISTHCHYEVARAHSYQPSYIAFGPVYQTNTKKMPWIPHGPKGFLYWRQVLDYPMVAIGGINKERINIILEQHADGVAMISAITQADDPDKATLEFLGMIDEMQSKRENCHHQALKTSQDYDLFK